MRKILAIAWNDIKNEFSESSTLIFFLVLPIVFTAIIGAALKNAYGDSSDDPRLPILVSGVNSDPVAAALVDLLDTSDTLRVVEVTEEEGLELLKDGYPALLKIPASFSASSLELVLSAQDNTSLGIQQALNTTLTRLGTAQSVAAQSVAEAEKIQPFSDENEKQAYYQAAYAAAQQLLANPPTYAVTNYARVSGPQIATGNEQSSPGQLVTWVLITLVGGSEVFVDERLKGTLKRMLATPTSRATIITGKITGRFALGLLQMILLIGFGAIVLKVTWGRSLAALALMLISFGLAGTALGVMLGAFARTRKQAGGLTTLFSMLLAALGGAWWPLEVTPTSYQAAVQVLPSTWAMRGLNDVILRGEGLSGVMPEAAVLLLFAALFFALGIWKLSKE